MSVGQLSWERHNAVAGSFVLSSKGETESVYTLALVANPLIDS